MISWILGGGYIPILLMSVGVYFLFLLRFQPLRSPKRMLCAMRQPSAGGVSPFRAVTLALAGTLGVGNIVGVANAVWIGGAGAVFWMWISALVAMILKYAEIVLAVLHRRARMRGGFFGGAYYYIKDHFFAKRRYRIGLLLSGAFALLMVFNALSMGCMIQVRAVSSAFLGVMGMPEWACGLLLMLLVLPFLFQGASGISALTEWLIPIMSGGYVVLSVAVLLIRYDAVGAAFASIFRDAFSADGMVGGVMGILTSKAIQLGTMRGLLSNEAGCGTAPTAHAAAETDSAAAQGIWGIFEVFVDTILLCTATALVILVGGDALSVGSDGVMMTIEAYASVLGGWSGYFLAAAVFCFAYATVLCWAHYGMESIAFLSMKKRWKYLYATAFIGCIWLGVVLSSDCILACSDFAIAVLTTVNLSVLLLMRKEIKKETKLWVDKG